MESGLGLLMVRVSVRRTMLLATCGRLDNVRQMAVEGTGPADYPLLSVMQYSTECTSKDHQKRRNGADGTILGLRFACDTFTLC